MSETKFRPYDKKRKILLVEDEQVNQEILQACLQGTYEVLPAMTGAEALEIIDREQETLSMVLLDLMLPDMHGMDILRRMRKDVRTAGIPVIVMTADSKAEVECLSHGAVDFIPKPYPRPEIVQARVRRIIELSEDREILRWTERDALTGLYNREFFNRYARQLDTFHPEEPSDAAILNITQFHMINDRYGRAYGDAVLAAAGEEIRELLKETGGIASRSDSDTFCFYCPHREDYAALLERLADRVNRDISGENRIRLRMGVYALVDKELDIDRRFDRAKMAADTARSGYSNSVGWFSEAMYEKEKLDARLVEDFAAALREKQFTVYFQPKFHIRGEKPVLASAEALVRWNHPEMGMVSPGIFIPVFEANGLVRALDRYVWAAAAEKIRDWRDRLGITLPVSVNVSRIDLFDPRIFDNLREIVEKNGIGYRNLLLEVTESAYTEDSAQIVEKVNQLRAMGFRIEMDDFGSGYSSLNMLSILPIDALKLDMRFIRHAFSAEGRDTRLLEAMIKLAEAFEVPTIAEGVETAEQCEVLRAMGCDYIQGYYFSRPLPADAFEAYMLEHRPGEN